MKLFATSFIFPVPWHTLTTANWRKYPNDKAEHVVSCDVLDRYVDEKGVLYTERLLVCKQNVPGILRKLGVADTHYFREISMLDPVTRSYSATTFNLSLTNMCNVEETCSFVPDPESPLQSTLFVQKGHVTAMKAFSSLGRLIEEAAVSRFYANAHVGRQALQSVVERILNEANNFESTFVSGLDSLKRELSQNN